MAFKGKSKELHDYELAVTRNLIDGCMDKGMTINDISKMTGIPRNTISLYHNGRYAIGVGYLAVVCRAFGVSADEALGLRGGR